MKFNDDNTQKTMDDIPLDYNQHNNAQQFQPFQQNQKRFLMPRPQQTNNQHEFQQNFNPYQQNQINNENNQNETFDQQKFVKPKDDIQISNNPIIDHGTKQQEKPFTFTDKNVRLNFIKKVYAILATQLVLTFCFILIAYLSKEYRDFQKNNIWLVYLCLAINIVTLYALACYRNVARKVPLNYILLAIFTLTECYTISIITGLTDGMTVLMAGSLTAAVTVSLTIYAFKTKRDFTTCGGFLFVCVAALLVGSIIGAIVRSKLLNLGLSVLGVIIYGLYLIFDTQLLVGKNKHAFSIDDYIVAAMFLYIDIIQIFLYILQIFSSSNQLFDDINFIFVTRLKIIY